MPSDEPKRQANSCMLHRPNKWLDRMHFQYQVDTIPRWCPSSRGSTPPTAWWSFCPVPKSKSSRTEERPAGPRGCHPWQGVLHDSCNRRCAVLGTVHKWCSHPLTSQQCQHEGKIAVPWPVPIGRNTCRVYNPSMFPVTLGISSSERGEITGRQLEELQAVPDCPNTAQTGAQSWDFFSHHSSMPEDRSQSIAQNRLSRWNLIA